MTGKEEGKGRSMVFMLDGNSEHAGHAYREKVFSEKKNQICDYSR